MKKVINGKTYEVEKKFFDGKVFCFEFSEIRTGYYAGYYFAGVTYAKTYKEATFYFAEYLANKTPTIWEEHVRG